MSHAPVVVVRNIRNVVSNSMVTEEEKIIHKYIKDESLKDWKETDPDMSWQEWIEDALNELDTTVKKFKYNVHAKFREAQVLKTFLQMDTDTIINELYKFYNTELDLIKSEKKQEVNEHTA